MRDQADRLRELVRCSAGPLRIDAHHAPLAAISGARRGEGATSLVSRLGIQLARMKKRVILIDADLTAPGLTRLLNAPSGGLDEVLLGHRRVVETLTTLDDRLQLLTGSRAREQAALGPDSWRRLREELDSLSSRADVVLIDAGAGMSPWVDQIWQMAGEVLLLCRRDQTSLKFAYQTLKLASAERLDARVRMVVNECDDPAAVRRLGGRLAATCERFLSLRLREPLGLARWEDEGDACMRSVRALATEVLWESASRESEPACTLPPPPMNVASRPCIESKFFQ